MSSVSERVGILASGDRKSGGGGSTAEKVVRDVLEQRVGFKIGVVICNNPEGTVGVHGKIDRLNKEFGLRGDDRIPVVTIDHAEYPRQDGDPERGLRNRESSEYRRTLERYDIGFAWMLGFMLIARGELIEARGWRPEYARFDAANNGIYHPDASLGNNHPAILPWTADTHGLGAHARAVELYRKGLITHTAMSFHLAEEGIDTGPIVYADPVEIRDTDEADSLSDRVQAVEKEKTAEVIERHLILREQHMRNL